MADSWRYGTTFVDFQIYFGFVDFDEASDVFSYVCHLTVLMDSYLEQEAEKPLHVINIFLMPAGTSFPGLRN